MEATIIFESDFIKITRIDSQFYIESFKKGMSINEFNKLMINFPQIRVTKFNVLKDCLLLAPKSAAVFGDVKERIAISISGDELKAFLLLNVNKEEINGPGKRELIKEIIKKLNESGVIFGIKSEVFLNGLANNKTILIAEGIYPQNGKDSEIKMYELSEPQPQNTSDGKVDYYELELINTVKTGDWLGERIDPTEGTPGKSVKGQTIAQIPGKKYPLLYDEKTVKEVFSEGKTTLYAIRDGAVNYIGEKISVSDYLEIDGNVDFNTGNVDFDGFLTVKGSVEDNFSVIADNDVEILGDFGVGSVNEISSRKGNVYIRGGIAGKNRAVIKSKKNIYTKFISDATVICDGTLHIGSYCMNSNVTAKQVIFDSPKSQIMGGEITAEIKVICAVIGTKNEKRTLINVRGFNRNALKEVLERIIKNIENLKKDLVKAKQEIAIYSNTRGLNDQQKNALNSVKERYSKIQEDLKELEAEKKDYVEYLKTPGEGAVIATSKIFPKVRIQIKNEVEEVINQCISTTFCVQDCEMKKL